MPSRGKPHLQLPDPFVAPIGKQRPTKLSCSPQTTCCLSRPRLPPERKPSLPAVNGLHSSASTRTILAARAIWLSLQPNVMHLPTRERRSDTHRCGGGGGILFPWKISVAERGIGDEEKCRERAGSATGKVEGCAQEELGKNGSFRRGRGAMTATAALCNRVKRSITRCPSVSPSYMVSIGSRALVREG